MFGIKTKILNNLKKHLEVVDINKSISKIEKIALIFLIKKELKRESSFVDIQQPINKKTNRFASKIIKQTSDYMPNNLGNWSIKKPQTLTTTLELNVIDLIKKQYFAKKNIIGHFSSGTTEGNIYATWIARNYLREKLNLSDCKKLILIKSSLAHYSIDKSADIAGLKVFETSIDETEFNINLDELKNNIKNLYKKGFKGFIIPITIGYTITGTEDDYIGIAKICNNFEKLNPDSKFFLWIDAAYSGIIKSYIDPEFKPFANKKIQLISTDLHKSLAIPYPASMLLYKKELLNYIKKPIPYIDQLDTTLLGSRPGIIALASWFTLINLSKKEIKNHFKNAINYKNKYLKRFVKDKVNLKIINNKSSLQACLVSKDKKTDRFLNKKYRLKGIDYKLMCNKKIKIFKLYKLYFFVKI